METGRSSILAGYRLIFQGRYPAAALHTAYRAERRVNRQHSTQHPGQRGESTSSSTPHGIQGRERVNQQQHSTQHPRQRGESTSSSTPHSFQGRERVNQQQHSTQHSGQRGESTSSTVLCWSLRQSSPSLSGPCYSISIPATSLVNQQHLICAFTVKVELQDAGLHLIRQLAVGRFGLCLSTSSCAPRGNSVWSLNITPQLARRGRQSCSGSLHSTGHRLDGTV